MFSKLFRPQSIKAVITNQFLLNQSRYNGLVRGSACLQHGICRYSSLDQAGNSKEIKIYYGDLTPRIKAVKVFSLTTSLTGICAQPIIMEQGSKLGGAPMMWFLCTFVGFFTFVTPVLLHFITNKYVTEMSFNPETGVYTAVTISFLLRKIETKFRVGDVKVPEVPGMFTSFVVNGTPMFVDAKQFTDTDHYIKMMGYDKPLDLKLQIDEDGSRSKEKK